MEQRPLRILVAAGLVASLLGVGYALRAARSGTAPAGPLADAPAVFDADRNRIRVEVINTTAVRGLARRATLELRDAGFDVVRYANDAGLRESTLVLDRSGNPDWAERVARALGGARVEARPDSSRYLDVTVLLGTDWRPPAKSFRP